MGAINKLYHREPLDTIIQSNISLSRITHIKDLLASMSSIICILNTRNQIVFYNDVITEKYGLNIEQDILGIRPGEVFQCVNATNGTGGCGTTEKCEYCGAYKAFDECWTGKKKVVKECRIVREKGEGTIQLDLEITATPFFHDEEFIVVSMQDITEKKRKALLERIFFHDIINIAGSLSGILQLLPMLSEEEKEEYLTISSSLSSQIIDEIKAQQQMVRAENGELQVAESLISSERFLNKVADQVKFHQVAQNKFVETLDLTDNVQFVSDETLLTRVLINMAKNALEAIPLGEKIKITATNGKSGVRFEVFNPTYMPKEVQLQLFQRSFSTKGNNRGLGTYSMKLLGEQYLGGKVDFFCSPESGTTFFIEIPRSSQNFIVD